MAGARAMPNNPDAEMAVLGGVLLRNDAINPVIELCAPDDFYVPAHQEIFRAMLSLTERGQPLDPLTLEAELKGAGKLGQAGGLVYLGELQSRVPTAENVGHYARLVRDASTVRQLIQRASEISAQGYTDPGDVGDYLDQAEQRVFEIAQRATRSSFRHVKPIVKDVFESLGRRMERHQAVTGVPTGFADLDRITCGLQPGELIILAARPSVGKTSFALNLALHAAMAEGLPVLVFSIEMSAEAVGERLLCAQARIDSNRVRGGFMDHRDWEKITGAAGQISKTPLFIDDAASPSTLEIRAKSRRFRSDRSVFTEGKDIGLVIVDYLQLVKPSANIDSREQQVASVSRGLKALAKELKLPVIALSQLNRSVEDREGPPRLSDLRESGAIEQDADVVAFLHRDPKGEDRSLLKLIIAKQRNGPVGDVDLVFLSQYTRFESAARQGGGGSDDSGF